MVLVILQTALAFLNAARQLGLRAGSSRRTIAEGEIGNSEEDAASCTRKRKSARRWHSSRRELGLTCWHLREPRVREIMTTSRRTRYRMWRMIRKKCKKSDSNRAHAFPAMCRANLIPHDRPHSIKDTLLMMRDPNPDLMRSKRMLPVPELMALGKSCSLFLRSMRHVAIVWI